MKEIYFLFLVYHIRYFLRELKKVKIVINIFLKVKNIFCGYGCCGWCGHIV